MIEAGVLHVIIPVAMIVCAVFVAVFKDLLYAVVALAVLSLLLAFQYGFCWRAVVGLEGER